MVVIKTSFVNLTVFQILFHLGFRFSVDLPTTNTHDVIVNSQGQTGYVKDMTPKPERNIVTMKKRTRH